MMRSTQRWITVLIFLLLIGAGVGIAAWVGAFDGWFGPTTTTSTSVSHTTSTSPSSTITTTTTSTSHTSITTTGGGSSTTTMGTSPSSTTTSTSGTTTTSGTTSTTTTGTTSSTTTTSTSGTTTTTTTSSTTTTTGGSVLPTGSQQVFIDLVAQNMDFNLHEIIVSAGADVTITFHNEDASVMHNFALYAQTNPPTPLFVGDNVLGVGIITYHFTAPSQPGTYIYRCDTHASMHGNFVVQ